MTPRGREVFDCRTSDALTLALRQRVPGADPVRGRGPLALLRLNVVHGDDLAAAALVTLSSSEIRNSSGHDEVVGDERVAPVGHEGQGDAGEGQEAQDAGHDEEGLEAP